MARRKGYLMERISPPTSAIIMKVGYHSSEGFEDIVLRKQMEENKCGVFYWGYGGVLCHPTKQVKPFISLLPEEDVLWLLMIQTPSRFVGDPIQATQFSVDGNEWLPTPSCATITGSRFAFVCQDLEKVDFSINLSKYVVGIGLNKGRSVSNYMRYRVDKACAIWQPAENLEDKLVTVSHCARIVPPFSIFVR